MSARDDLVAAMEAINSGKVDSASTAWWVLKEHGKHLLALLDAEPVAVVMIKDGAIVGSRMQVTMPDNPALRLYARPEASDE